MQLLAPDILAEARDLPIAVTATGLALGLALWALGWWGHRFWIVLFTTLLAGIFGLAAGPVSSVQPLVVAVLLAVAAGALALHLSRVLAFAAGGLTLWVAVHAAVPTWEEPWVCFLAGGLLGLVLFRFWTMAVTTLAGTLLMGYSGLCLVDQLGRVDAVLWSAKQTHWINWICLGVALVGWVLQFLLERWHTQRRREQEDKIRAKAKEAKAKEKEKKRSRQPSVWSQLLGLRKAG